MDKTILKRIIAFYIDAFLCAILAIGLKFIVQKNTLEMITDQSDAGIYQVVIMIVYFYFSEYIFWFNN